MVLKKIPKATVKKGRVKKPPAAVKVAPLPTAAALPTSTVESAASSVLFPTTAPTPRPGSPLVGTPANGAPGASGQASPQGPSATAGSGVDQGPAIPMQGPAVQGQGSMGAGQPGSAQGPAVTGHPGSMQGPAGTGTPATGAGTAGTHATGTGTPAHTGRGRSKGLQAVSKLRKPRGNQATLAPSVAAEVRRSAVASEYRGEFGPHAPDPDALAAILEQAGALSLEEARQKQRWIAVRDQRNQVWDQALTGVIETFQTCFQFAVAQNDTIAPKFPSTEVFLGTAAAIGARGAATRKARKTAAPPTTNGG